jgi:hypothetical protein
MLGEKIGVGYAAADIVVLVPPHDEKVGQRQDGDGYPGIREAARQGCDLARRHRRQFGHMADRDPAAAAILLGQFADEMDVHCLGRVADIEVDIDVDVEFAGELKDPPDLTGMVGVVSRRAADNSGAAFQRFGQQLLGAGIIGQPVLRKNADFDVDGPPIIGSQRLHSLKSAQPDSGIDLDLGAHSRRAVENALGERTLRPGAQILDGKAAFQRRDLLHRAYLAPRFGRRAADDTGFVEMDVRLDQSATSESPAGIIGLRFRHKARFDRDNLPVRYTDVDRRFAEPVRKPHIAYDQVHFLNTSATRPVASRVNVVLGDEIKGHS